MNLNLRFHVGQDFEQTNFKFYDETGNFKIIFPSTCCRSRKIAFFGQIRSKKEGLSQVKNTLNWLIKEVVK